MKLRRLLLARGPLAAALLFVLPALVVVATLLSQHGIGSAQGPIEFGADTDPDGNSATSLGPRQGCISVDAGDTFDLDITVSDVDDLVAWELYLRFDPSIIEVVDADMDMFLANNPQSSVIRKSDFYVGQHFLGAADRRLLGESGSGVLARVVLHAKGPGLTHMDIPSIDFDGDGDIDKGPRLTDSSGNALGDVTGDAVFDGPTYHALIAVDRSCDAAPPTPTLPPSPTPQPGGDSGDPTFEPPPDASPPPDDASAPDNGQDSPTDGSGEADTGESTPAASGNSDQAPGGDSSASSSSGGGLPLWAIGSIAAAVLLAATGTGVLLAARAGGSFPR